MNKLQYLSGLVCLVIVAAVVSACGGSSSNTSTPAAPPNPKTTTTSAPTTTSAATTSASSTTSAQSSSGSSSSGGAVSAKAGETIFKGTCGACHTLAAAGTHGTVGPDLDQAKPVYKCVVQQVTNGGAVKPPCKAVAGSIMPSFAHTFSKTQIESIAKFVSSVAGKGGSGSSGGGGGGIP